MAFEKIRKLRRGCFKAAQKLLITLFLFVFYVAGFGVTFILALLFNRSILWKKNGISGTSWQKAQGYGPDIDECRRQS